jgi:hypothetical protein
LVGEEGEKGLSLNRNCEGKFEVEPPPSLCDFDEEVEEVETKKRSVEVEE